MENKSGSKAGSKSDLNESSVPLLEETEKGDLPEKIEMETKNDNADEKKDLNETKDKKGLLRLFSVVFNFQSFNANCIHCFLFP